MDFFIPPTDKDINLRKKEAWSVYAKIAEEGRKNPVWFQEFAFGVKLQDFQKWMMMNSWITPFVMWLCCRATGKTTLLGILAMTKMLLQPDYRIYVSATSSNTAIEVFKKIEDITFDRIPTFKTLTDCFEHEVFKPRQSLNGFIHSTAGHKFRLFNNSQLETLSSNENTIRGKRGTIFYDETAFQTEEQFRATQAFSAVDQNFGIGTSDISKYREPTQMPLQILYASSAGDANSPFYKRYIEFAKKMIIGDPNYFICDINADIVLNMATDDGKPIKSHLNRLTVENAMNDDPDGAQREYYNKFDRGAGQNAMTTPEAIERNSETYLPEFKNIDNKSKYILCIDPARSNHGSVLSVFRIEHTQKDGIILRVVNVISMVDRATKNKTPLPVPEQLAIIREAMISYNGEGNPEWENIEIYMDAGAGGGGVGAFSDQLRENWKDAYGVEHRGVMDFEHPQFLSSHEKFKNASPCIHLIEPSPLRKLMFASLEKEIGLNTIKFPKYDNRNVIYFEKPELTSKGRPKMISEWDEEKEKYVERQAVKIIEYELDEKEMIALAQCKLMKTELSYMECIYDANGNVSYRLLPDKKKLGDDRVYTLAMGAYVLMTLRREHSDKIDKTEPIRKELRSMVTVMNW